MTKPTNGAVEEEMESVLLIGIGGIGPCDGGWVEETPWTINTNKETKLKLFLFTPQTNTGGYPWKYQENMDNQVTQSNLSSS